MQELSPIIAFLAGLVSIASPCVLPLLPAIVASSTESGKLRPIAIIVGLAVSFVIMGVMAGLLGELFGQYIIYLDEIAAAIIIIMGSWMLFDLHLPPKISPNQFFDQISYHTYSIPTQGVAAGLLLGLALGVVWIPCTGPILGPILTLVAVGGDPLFGAEMLAIYSAGFAVPMVAIAYSSRIGVGLVHNASRIIWIKKFGGFVLLAIGVYLLFPYLPA
jgi:cytochrome c-type biogenesis protein